MSDNQEKKTCECMSGIGCPVADAIALIGGKWKLRILCSLNAGGTLRFNDIKDRIKDITPAMLSSSLKELERDGLVTRKQCDCMPVRVEYSITDRAKELWPALHRLAHWARKEPLDGDAETEG